MVRVPLWPWLKRSLIGAKWRKSPTLSQTKINVKKPNMKLYYVETFLQTKYVPHFCFNSCSSNRVYLLKVNYTLIFHYLWMIVLGNLTSYKTSYKTKKNQMHFYQILKGWLKHQVLKEYHHIKVGHLPNVFGRTCINMKEKLQRCYETVWIWRL